jgi:putative transcriptional regulator
MTLDISCIKPPWLIPEGSRWPNSVPASSTLRMHTVKAKPAPTITARELAGIRKDLNPSRGLFAGYLRTNVRTLENWELGRAKPNAQAALLIRMVQRFPDTVHRLADI